MYSLADISNSADADYFAVGKEMEIPHNTTLQKAHDVLNDAQKNLSGGSKLEIQKDLHNDQAIAPRRLKPAATVLKPFSTSSSLKNAIVVPMRNIKKTNKCDKARAKKISVLLLILLVLMVLLGITVKYKVF